MDFANHAGVQNILSRVTGNDPSDILGKLSVSGNANLFLINPNGIIFGSNASLDVRGSFLASTASRLNFADGNQFSATAHPTKPLLTVSVPIGLQFGATAAGISVQGSGLSVQPGKTLALVGGDITLQGEDLAASGEPNLAALGGRIELGSVAGIGEVSLKQRGKSWVLGYDRVNAFRNIKLEDGAFVDASGEGGGEIQIQGAELDLTEGSYIFADTKGTEAGSEVLVHTTGEIALSDGSLITADVLETGTGSGGDLRIETGQLRVQGKGSKVSATTYGQGNGGNLTVTASDAVELVGLDSGLFIQSLEAGSAGNLTIATRRLSVQDGARVSGTTSREGQGGNLTVTASDSVDLVGSSSSLSTQTQNAGAAGNLTITTRRLSVQDGAYVSASTFSLGKGGNLTVTASDSVNLVGSSSSLSTQTQGANAAGNLTIATRRLSVQDGANVSASTSGDGQGGTLLVTASESVELKGTSAEGNIPSGLFTATYDTGNAGNLTIATRRLSVRDGAQVSAATLSQGDGGDVQVNAFNSVNLFGVGSNGFSSGLFTRTTGVGQGGNITVDTSAFQVADGAVVDARTTAAGNGGNITVKADTLEAVNGGQLVASGFRGSSGRAGNITVNTTDSVTLSGSVPTSVKRFIRVAPNIIVENDDPTNSGLFVLSRGSGNAGNLQLTARSITLDNQGKLTAETASGDGGNITLLVADLLLLRRNSEISTTAGIAGAGGNGGNITIDNTPFIIAVPSENSDIKANAFLGQGGKVTINAQSIFGLAQRNLEDLQTLLDTNDSLKLDPINLPSSDITAISQTNPELSGEVTINTPDVDPSLGLVANPAELVDASRLIATSCGAGGENEFIITGRGGLPPNPSNTLSSDTVWSDLRTFTKLARTWSSSEEATNPTSSYPVPIVEATGWVINNKGSVVLTASARTATPLIFWVSPATCHTPESSS